MITLAEMKNSFATVSHFVEGELKTITVSELAKKVEWEMLRSPIREGELGVIVCANTIEWLTVYLASLNALCSIVLLPADFNVPAFEKVLAAYKPAWVWSPQNAYGNRSCTVSDAASEIWDGDTFFINTPQVLLTTSGSTGCAKFVRLSHSALKNNAQAISGYLNIGKKDNGLVNLPVSYSYGLSIVNSHLISGASIHLTEMSPIQKGFFECCRQLRISNLNGVPETHAMLIRMGLEKNTWPDLRFVTQAGGSMKIKDKTRMREISLKSNFAFYVMYGQTEAAPRMSWINLSKSTCDQVDSIGKPVQGGMLEICNLTGELIYTGPNVMLGYADGLEDLNAGDLYAGVLKTGDLGKQDSEGNFYLTGRLKRIGKISGKRVSLDQIEKCLELGFNSNIFCVDLDNGIAVAGIDIPVEDLKRGFMKNLPTLALSQVQFHNLSNFFFLPNGKPDYAKFRVYCQHER